MAELLHGELCYKIAGLAYEVDNIIGYGFGEKVYANALEESFKKHKIKYQREVYFPISMNGKVVAKKYFDFLIENVLVVELKVGGNKYKAVCNQLFQYLKASNLKLGLILRFTEDGVKVKRIPNLR